MPSKGPGTPKREDWSVTRESEADRWRDRQREVGHPLDYPNKGDDSNPPENTNTDKEEN
jgi:hypothetical protein